MRNRFASRLLSLKLTGQFILFGILVSYFSLILSVYSAGRQIIENFSREFVNRASLTMELHDGESWLENMFINEPEKGRALLDSIREIPFFQNRAVASFALYRNSGGDEGWIELFSDGDAIEGSDVEDEKWTAMLDEATKEGSSIRQPLYLGQGGHRIYLVNTTPPRSQYSYVAALKIAHFNLLRLIRDEWARLRYSTLGVVIFSLVLGQLFTRPLSRSLRSLTDKALSVSRGDEKVSFANDRWDDVGVLSRTMDSMTHTLRHRARTLKTMNLIDRAVLSSLSREELLTQVADYIAGQFPDSGVAVLEKEGQSFQVLALLAREEVSGKTRISYDEINLPPINLSDISGTDISSDSGLRLLFGDGGLKRQTITYPLVVEENPVGAVIITRDNLSEEDRLTLRMLADQTGIALKSLSDFNDRERLHRGMLLALIRAVDAKSRWTAGHSERVTRLALVMGERLGEDKAFLDMIRIGGLLHDIGKLAIPESILDKPGKLTDEEYGQIKDHPLRGDRILRDIPGLDEARRAVRNHHERWDGKGYPDGLAGEEIPRVARIISLCDVYDAVREDRPYRKGFSPGETRAFMMESRGTMFDPELLDCFIALLDEGAIN